MKFFEPPLPRAHARRRFLLITAGWPLIACARAQAAVQATARLSPEEEGLELARELCAQPPPFNTAGTLRRRDPEGRWLPPVPVRLDVYEASPGWRSVYQVFTLAGAITETLVVYYRPDGYTEYELTIIQPGTGTTQTRAFNGDEAALPFAQSDFWLTDLGLEFLRWPRQRVVKTEMRKGRKCRVLESVNPKPRAGNYARVLSWVDIEHRGLLRAEAFGLDGRLLKEFSIGSFKKVEGSWQLKHMEIRNEQTDSRTRLEFDLEIPD